MWDILIDCSFSLIFGDRNDNFALLERNLTKKESTIDWWEGCD